MTSQSIGPCSRFRLKSYQDAKARSVDGAWPLLDEDQILRFDAIPTEVKIHWRLLCVHDSEPFFWMQSQSPFVRCHSNRKRRHIDDYCGTTNPVSFALHPCLLDSLFVVRFEVDFTNWVRENGRDNASSLQSSDNNLIVVMLREVVTHS